MSLDPAMAALAARTAAAKHKTSTESKHPTFGPIGPTQIQRAVTSAGHYASAHALRELGYRMPLIHAAVRRGELRWTRDGRLEVVS